MTQAMMPLADIPRLCPALPQFAHIRRVWDVALGTTVARILPGEYYVTSHDELIFTVLGSCVSACVRERELGVGGMNHFMLPLDRRKNTCTLSVDSPTSATRYGDVAMERLIVDILRLGGRRENLEFKVVGGGKVLDIALDVGAHNAQFVGEYLKAEGFTLSAEDLGGCFARKVFYSPMTGNVRVKRLTASVNRAVFEREQDLGSSNAHAESGSEISRSAVRR